MNIIERIRAKIERRKKELEKDKTIHPANQAGRIKELDLILSSLSDLEKECEKPTNIDFEQELYKHFGQVKDFTLGMQIGKYFYELGCCRTAEKYDEIEYKRQRADVCEGLEEEIERYLHSLGVGYGGWVDGMEDDDLRGIARHFAKWQKEQDTREMIMSDGSYFQKCYELGKKDMKEQMMKEAVEGKVIKDISNKLAVTGKINLDGFEFGQKVKLIIVKEGK